MRILLVEDDPTLSRVVETLLKRNNYTVDAVFDGEEAVSTLISDDNKIYDAVIMDVMMPRLDGIGALKRIRQSGKEIPVLILSAKSEIDDKVLGLDSGANDYLTKPFDSKELLARLRALTRRNTVALDSVIKVGNVELNCNSCTISTAFGTYELVGKEYQIMHLFMSNPGMVMSAESIMEKIWEMDSEATVNTVWTYIAYVRRKLEAIEADIRITTKRNLGYVLEKV